jgi:hypothetical protein
MRWWSVLVLAAAVSCATSDGYGECPPKVETVLKALRMFRGSALLAAEVGLGKTIEAGC